MGRVRHINMNNLRNGKIHYYKTKENQTFTNINGSVGERPNWKLQYPLKKDLLLLFLNMCMCTQVYAGAEGSQRHQCPWISLELELRVLSSHPTWVLDGARCRGYRCSWPLHHCSSPHHSLTLPHSRREFYFLKKKVKQTEITFLEYYNHYKMSFFWFLFLVIFKILNLLSLHC